MKWELQVGEGGGEMGGRRGQGGGKVGGVDGVSEREGMGMGGV